MDALCKKIGRIKLLFSRILIWYIHKMTVQRHFTRDFLKFFIDYKIKKYAFL